MALSQLRIQSIMCFIYIRSEAIVPNPLLSRYHSVMCKVCSALLPLLLCLSMSPSHIPVSLWLLHARTYTRRIRVNWSPSVLHFFFFLQKHQCLYCSFSEPLMSLKILMWLNEGSYSISDTETNEGKVVQIENQLLLVVSFMMSSNAGYYESWKSLQI